MGSSANKASLAIIDELNKPGDFGPLFQVEQFHCSYYVRFEDFIEKQSLKELSGIVLREHEQKNEDIEGITNQKVIENLKEMQEVFGNDSQLIKSPLKYKLISYIKKYSLDHILIYMLVKDVLNFKLSDFEKPYVAFYADNISILQDQIKRAKEKPSNKNIKFNKLVKDLYKRVVVKVIDDDFKKDEESQGVKQWKRLMDSQKLSFDFYSNEEEFAKSLISSYSDYIIVQSMEKLTRLIDIRKIYLFESRLIFFNKNKQDEKSDIFKKKMLQVWSHSSDKVDIVTQMERCTNVLADEEPLKSQNTIIFTKLDYGRQYEKLILNELQDALYDKHIKKADQGKAKKNKVWIEKLNLKITNSYQTMTSYFSESIFSFIITFDFSPNEVEQLKHWIRKNNYNYRVYMYSFDEREENINEIESLLTKQKSAEQQKTLNKLLNSIAKSLSKNASFKIKFEIAPIESITFFKGKPREIMYIANKMGLNAENISSQQQFLDNYLCNNRSKFIDSYHIITKVKDYKNFLKEQINTESKDKRGYFHKLKIIIYDEKSEIKKYYTFKDQNDHQVVFIHFTFSKVQQFLQSTFAPKVSMPFFVKKSLPNFFEASKKIQRSKVSNLELKASIVSKNQLLQQVFQDQNFKLSVEYLTTFKKFTEVNYNEFEVQIFQNEYIKRYAMLWRIGYPLINKKNDKFVIECLEALKKDIKKCMFKCKTYELIKLSDEEFSYFYIDKINSCTTFIDLQIICTYIFSLPHGFTNIIEQVFKRPNSTCLTPKIFAPFLVPLLSCFCSFEDEVMDQKKLVLYVEDNEYNKIYNLNSGDIIFNSGFLMCGKFENSNEKIANHCIVFEFENVPFLSTSRIKNYLYIERFSFYKESAQYLIAPFTKFKVKSKSITKEYKVKIVLSFVSDNRTFIHNVFSTNDIKEDQLFDVIFNQIEKTKEAEIIQRNNVNIKNASSLYKKAEIIALYEEKRQLFNSIRQANIYKKFYRAFKNKKYLTALSQLFKKQHNDKNTTEIQAQYFKKMLGIEKSLINFKLSQYQLSIGELKQVVNYLKNQKVGQETDDWVISRTKRFEQSMEKIARQRQKLINKCEKVKYWKVYPSYDEESRKVRVNMDESSYEWRTNYHKDKQLFSIENMETKERYLPYQAKIQFGFGIPTFSPDSIYEKVDETERVLSELFLQPPKQAKQEDCQSSLKKEKKKTARLSPIKKQVKPKKQEKPNLVDSLLKMDKQQVIEESSPINKKYVESLLLQSSKKEEKDKKSQDQFENFQIVNFAKQIGNKNNSDNKSKELSFSDICSSMKIQEQIQWQVFYLGEDLIITKKGKHFKTKIGKK